MIADKTIGIVTFADMRLYRSLKRFKTMAKSMDVFDIVSVNSELDLPKDYLDRNRSLLTTKTRGFGYWCWKPFVVLNELNKNPNLDILFYSDVGSHIRKEGRPRLLEYIQFLQDSDHEILGFHSSPESPYPFPFNEVNSDESFPVLIEAHWTKGDMFELFGITQEHPHPWSPQIGAGLFAVKNTINIRSFFRKWINHAYDYPHLFNDEPSKVPNFNGFVENRHDQSYFSLSAKQMGYVQLSYQECQFIIEDKAGRWKSDWNRISKSPFHYRRDKQKSIFWWKVIKFIKSLNSS